MDPSTMERAERAGVKDAGWLTQLLARGKSVFAGPAARARRADADALYAAAVAQARRPAFYAVFGAPDTRDGRLELVQLHVILLLRRLQRGDAEATALGQELFNVFFLDLDRSLREAGVGDLSVGKWVKKLAQQFYARVTAIEAGLAQDDVEGLARVLRTTLFTETDASAEPNALARYMLATDRTLAADVAAGTPVRALRFNDIDPIEAGSPFEA